MKSEVVVFIVTNIVTKLTLYKGRSEKMEKKYIYIFYIFSKAMGEEGTKKHKGENAENFSFTFS